MRDEELRGLELRVAKLIGAELKSAGMYGAYKIAEKGGYCSRDHAYKDND